jgi:hypothetical protein
VLWPNFGVGGSALSGRGGYEACEYGLYLPLLPQVERFRLSQWAGPLSTCHVH